MSLRMGPEYCTKCGAELEEGQIGLCDDCQHPEAKPSTTRKATAVNLTKSDCVEISCALGDEELMEKIGTDGEDLAAGTIALTPDEAETAYFAVSEKRDRMLEGFYDDYTGQVKKPRSATGRWAKHLAAIMAKLMPLAAGSRENHVETSLHRSGCAACQMVYDKNLPDSPSAA